MNNFLNSLITEEQNKATRHIDQLSTEEIIGLINMEDQLVPQVIKSIIPDIAKATDLIIASFQSGGRLFYFGAGTSGRIGILDASECPPTYGTDPELVQGIIAGGDSAIRVAVEGAEDSMSSGESDVDKHHITSKDVVVGIASSGRTPYVIGALKRASEIGASTISISNNPQSVLGRAHADVIIEAVVGPEVILGSTRMKAGTAQKMILNMLTTTAMIRIGKVYDNLMVDLQPSNEKLIQRSKNIIKIATGASEDLINRTFSEADHHVKTAIVMILANTDVKTARLRLNQADGFVRKAIEVEVKESHEKEREIRQQSL